MEASEIRAARDRLVLKRNAIIQGLHARTEAWPELRQVCRELVELEQKLGRLVDLSNSARVGKHERVD